MTSRFSCSSKALELEENLTYIGIILHATDKIERSVVVYDLHHVPRPRLKVEVGHLIDHTSLISISFPGNKRRQVIFS